MHIETAVISSSVAVALYAVSGSASVIASRRLSSGAEDSSSTILRSPRLRALAVALVFALQMLNFAIPATGSSGHVVGAVLLASLLGRWRAFLSMGAILTLQSLLFADGGLLALGANLFNMGVLPCLVIYPLVGRWLKSGRGRLFVASAASAVVGAFFAALEISVSGLVQLDYPLFFLNMVGLHAVIGIVEGLLSLVLVNAMAKQGEERLFLPLGGAVLLSAAVLQLFASSFPDGLEFSLVSCATAESSFAPDALHLWADRLQDFTSLLPGYALGGLEALWASSAAGVIGVALLFGLSQLFFRTEWKAEV